MTRTEKLRLKRLRLRVLTIGIILMFLGGFGIFKRIISVSNANSVVVQSKGNEDILLIKSPSIMDLENKKAQLVKAREEEELNRIRSKLREEKIQAELEREKNLKIAYLTFDDGPSTKSTPAILDILKEEGVKATFFVQGQNVSYYPDIFKRIYEEGHGIGHHSYSHDYKYLYASTNNFMNDIYKTEEAMQKVLGEDFKTNLLRLPGGAFGPKKQHYVNVAASKGYTNYNWNALNGDAEGHGLPASHLLNRLKNTVGNQRKVIILMHDTNAKASTVESLPGAIKYLKDKGYEFRTLD